MNTDLISLWTTDIEKDKQGCGKKFYYDTQSIIKGICGEELANHDLQLCIKCQAKIDTKTKMLNDLKEKVKELNYNIIKPDVKPIGFIKVEATIRIIGETLGTTETKDNISMMKGGVS